jgi:hypothetical protein
MKLNFVNYYKPDFTVESNYRTLTFKVTSHVITYPSAGPLSHMFFVR